jgi:hypothetical protein
MADQEDPRERQFDDTPSGWHRRWRMELNAAKKAREKYDREGSETIRRFLDEREKHTHDEVRVNVYTSNVQTQEAMLYGKTPKTDVARSFSDWMDEGARIGAEMLDRLLNSDVGRSSDTYAAAIEYALSDFLRPGLGVVKLRLEIEFDQTPGQPARLDQEGNELAPEVPEADVARPGSEVIHHEWWHWRDVFWSAEARTWHDARWVGFRSYYSSEEGKKFFGENVWAKVKAPKKDTEPGPGETDARKHDPWTRTEVYEVWDKEHGCVWWWVNGLRVMVTPGGVDAAKNGSVEDPLELEGFWPCPRPMMANLTTDRLMPRSDYALIQDLLRQIDQLSTRIDRLTKAMRVAGVYDKSAGEIGRLVSEATEAELIAVDGWAKFVEKGGLKGAIDWLPIEQISAALQTLREMRQEAKAILDEVSGYSDIVRGQQQAGQTATTSAIEAKFASVRLQRRQDELARFAGDLKSLEAQIISKHFSDETILERSNILATPNRDKAPLGLEAIRSKLMQYRITVKPESIALTDWGRTKAERSEVIQTLGAYFQSTIPFIQMAGQAGPQAAQAALQFVMTTAQWLMAGIRGGADLEEVFNQFITQMKQIAAAAAAQPPQQHPPDPRLMAAQVKAGAEATKAKLGVVQSVVDAKAHQQKTAMDLQAATVEHEMGLQKLEVQQRSDAMRSVASVIPGPNGG